MTREGNARCIFSGFNSKGDFVICAQKMQLNCGAFVVFEGEEKSGTRMLLQRAIHFVAK